MTPNDERKVRDVLRRLDPELDGLVWDLAYQHHGEQAYGEVDRLEAQLESMVGKEEAAKFIADGHDDHDCAHWALAHPRRQMGPGVSGGCYTPTQVPTRDPRAS